MLVTYITPEFFRLLARPFVQSPVVVELVTAIFVDGLSEGVHERFLILMVKSYLDSPVSTRMKWLYAP